MKKWIAMFAVIGAVLLSNSVSSAQPYWNRTTVATTAGWFGEEWLSATFTPCTCLENPMECPGDGLFYSNWDLVNGSDSATVSTFLGPLYVGPNYIDTWLNYGAMTWNVDNQAVTSFSGITAGGWISQLHIEGEAAATSYSQGLTAAGNHDLVRTNNDILSYYFNFAMSSGGSDIGPVIAGFWFQDWRGLPITINIDVVLGSLATYVDDFGDYTEDFFNYSGSYGLTLQCADDDGGPPTVNVTYYYGETNNGGVHFGLNANGCYQELAQGGHASSHNFSVLVY